MFIVGELRDQKMAQEMEKELILMGLSAKIEHDPKTEMNLIFVTKEEDFTRAQDYYRVKLGLQKPSQMDEEWVKIKTLPRGRITYAILVLCIVIFVMSYTEMGKRLYDLFYIAKPESGFLYEVSRGQLWRLLTPVFLHLSIMHILFNMLWFKDLGYLIEHLYNIILGGFLK